MSGNALQGANRCSHASWPKLKTRLWLQFHTHHSRLTEALTRRKTLDQSSPYVKSARRSQPKDKDTLKPLPIGNSCRSPCRWRL